MSSRRIEKETQKLQLDPRKSFYNLFHVSAPGISAEADPDNGRYFRVLMSGPEGTAYEGVFYF